VLRQRKGKPGFFRIPRASDFFQGNWINGSWTVIVFIKSLATKKKKKRAKRLTGRHQVVTLQVLTAGPDLPHLGKHFAGPEKERRGELFGICDRTLVDLSNYSKKPGSRAATEPPLRSQVVNVSWDLKIRFSATVGSHLSGSGK